MTREEAKHYLSVPSSTNGSGRCTDEQHYEAKQIALQALEQEPCDDAISREWLKTAIHNFYYGLKHTPTEEDIQAYIDVAPSVRPQEQTGHWIFDEILDRHYYCSECKSMGVDYWDFCPNCGARMVEPKESEEL